MFKQLVILCAIASAVLCRHAPSNMNALYSEQISEKTMGSDDKGDDNFMANWDISSIYSNIKNYTNSDISVYLKMKLLSGIESATRGDLELGSGIRLVRDNTNKDASEDNDANLNAELRSLPRGLNDREDALTSMIWKKFNKLLRTHTMQVSKVLRTAENTLQDFVNYVWRYEVPSFILDVIEYKVDKLTHGQDKKRKRRKKHKKRKKRKKKKKPQVEEEHYDNSNKKPKKPKKKKKKKRPQGEEQHIHIHVEHDDDSYGHDDSYHDEESYLHGHSGHHGHHDDDDDYEYRLPYPINYLED